MIYYVYQKSSDEENLVVKPLIDMLSEVMEKQARAQSASRKSRPESSSPEKLKMRNLHKQAAASDAKKPGGDEDDENYSDENIALDDGSGEDEIDDPEKNKNLAKQSRTQSATQSGKQ